MLRACARILMLILATVCCACAPALHKQLPQLASRQQPALKIGSEMVLLEHQPLAAEALLAADGLVHIFVLTDNDHIQHVQISKDGVVSRENIGMLSVKIDPDAALNVDAIEYALGNFQVRVGRNEYIRSSNQDSWIEQKDSPCLRYFTHNGRMFCAGLLSGSEISQPARTDWYIGAVVILPIAWFKTAIPTKVALFEKEGNYWRVRAIVNPQAEMDSDFYFMGQDRCSTLHIVFQESRGGAWFLILGGPGGAGGIGGTPPEALHYVQLPVTKLNDGSLVGQKEPSDPTGSTPWFPLSSSQLYRPRYAPSDPDYSSRKNIPPSPTWYKSYHFIKFAVNPERCTIEAYKRLGLGGRVGIEDGEIYWPDNESVLTEISLRDGTWEEKPEIVVASGVPISELDGDWDDPSRVIIDLQGDSHLLTRHTPFCFINCTTKIVYLERLQGAWSKPLILGPADRNEHSDLLVAGQDGDLLVGWIDDRKRFVARWLTRTLP